jgi:hypothetical protein
VIRVDAIRDENGALEAVCSGDWGIGSQGTPSARLAMESIDAWLAAHPQAAVREIRLDLRDVDYEWGDGPAWLFQLFRHRGFRFALRAGPRSLKGLRSLVDAFGLSAELTVFADEDSKTRR